jgi:hypothetical protein
MTNGGIQDTQQVCERGHQVNSSFHNNPEFRRDFCERCGARTIFSCPTCHKEIPGHYYTPGVVSFVPTPVPEFCRGCGNPFPWAGKKAAAAAAKMPFGTPDQTIETVLDRFHAVVRQLRHRHDNRNTLSVEDEYDAQDLLHALLLIFFDDVRPEEWTPSYAGGSARMDFLLKAIKTVIEVKKWRKGHTAKGVGDELLIDIGRYREHPDCQRLVCFVYDPEGRLPNPRAMENDLSGKRDSLEIRVMIRPA